MTNWVWLVAAAIGWGAASCGWRQDVSDGGSETIVSGSVTLWDWPANDGGTSFGPWERAPARGVVVYAVDEATGAVFAEGQTDAAGGFSLGANRWPERWFVRAQARLEGASLRARVLSESGEFIGWTLRSEVFSGEVQAPVDLVTAPNSAINGALHITDTIYRVDQFLSAAGVPASAQPELRMWWSPTQSFRCGSCFVGKGVWLGGAPEDPDEYDDQIIMHEVFHFLTSAWGADTSPGGRHVGDPLIPTLAWGEGVATAFALMVSEDPVYVDFRESYVRVFEVEEGADPRFWGTSAGGVAGDVSEYLVAALLWDLFDGDDALEAPYSVEVPTSVLLELMRDWMPSNRRVGLGYRGLDLADFFAGLYCTKAADAPTLQAMLDHRLFPLQLSLVDCATPWRYPSTRDEPPPPAPLSAPDVKLLALRLEGGEVQLEHASLPTHTFDVRVQRRGDAGNYESRVTCEGTPCLVASSVESDEVVIVTGEWEAQEPFGLSSVGASAGARLLGEFSLVDTPNGPVREYRSTTLTPDGSGADDGE